MVIQFQIFKIQNSAINIFKKKLNTILVIFLWILKQNALKVYVVVKESSSDSTVTGSVVLGVFADENSTIECANRAYES